MKIEKLLPSKIRRDGGTQPRAALDSDTITEYADAMRREVKLPILTVFFDGEAYWLADGFHRLAAHLQAHGSAEPIGCDVRQGTQRDAILHSVGVNDTHGLRRTNEDKRRSVMRLLEDAEWSQWSDREIARHTKTTHPFVGKVRSELTGNVTSDERTYTTKHGTLATMNTANIGATNAEEQIDNEDQPNPWYEINHPDLPEDWILKRMVEGILGYNSITLETTIAFGTKEEAVAAVLSGDHSRENWSHHLTVSDLAHGNFVYYLDRATAEQVEIAIHYAPKLGTGQSYIRRLESKLRALRSGRARPITDENPTPSSPRPPKAEIKPHTLNDGIREVWALIKQHTLSIDPADRLQVLEKHKDEVFDSQAYDIVHAELTDQIRHRQKVAARSAAMQPATVNGSEDDKPTQADPSITVDEVEALIGQAITTRGDCPELAEWAASSWSIYLRDVYGRKPMIDTTRRALKTVSRQAASQAEQIGPTDRQISDLYVAVHNAVVCLNREGQLETADALGWGSLRRLLADLITARDAINRECGRREKVPA